MKKLLLLCSIMLFVAAGCGKSQSNTVIIDAPNFFDGIQIKGDGLCLSKTKEALALLKQKSPKNYGDVKSYIGIVECVPSGSGMYANENPPRFVVGNQTRDAGSIWYAGAIAHDANHSKLYHQYLLAHLGQPVPSEIWIGKQAETECIAAQRVALVNLGADKKTLDYLDNVINTNYWDNPSRTW